MSAAEDAPESVVAGDRAAILSRIVAIRDAARTALGEAVAEPTMVRAAGRALGIDKTLAWKLVSLTEASDPAAAMSKFPGPRGWQRIIEALAAHGASRSSVETLRRGLDDLEREAAGRGFDRRRLQRLASEPDGSHHGRAETLRLRETAAAANAAIWGIGARLLVASYLVRPTGESDRLAISAVTMFLGLHRTRPGPEMPIHRGARLETSGGTSSATGAGSTAIDCSDLCSPGAATQTSVQTDRRGPCITFRGDRTSPAHPVDLVFAETLTSSAYSFARHVDEQATFGLPIWVPVQALILEVLLHRDIPWPGSPSPTGFSEIVGASHHLPWRDLQAFRVSERPEPPTPLDTAADTFVLPVDSASATTSASYATAITRAAEAIGGRPDEFVRHRLIVPHPPLSSNLVLRWPLPTGDA